MTTNTFETEPDTLGRPTRVRLPSHEVDLGDLDLGLPANLKIVDKISQGGMGAIYKAYDDESGEMRAVKVLLPQYAQDSVYLLRFTREARTARILNNQHVVSIHNSGVSETKLPYIVMELVDGCTLFQLLEDRKLKTEEVVVIFLQVANALAHAHHHGIIHRDLKPTNIMITTDEMNNILVKVVDFGIAKSFADFNTLNTELTHDGEVLGTPSYMSPEQALARPLDQRSDIYSLGAVMYYALTGSPPFRAASVVEVLEGHLKGQAIGLSTVRNDIPKQLSMIVEKMLEKRPEDRYQTMNDLIGDLKSHTLGRRVSVGMTARQRRSVRQILALVRLALISFCISWLTFALANVIWSATHGH